MRCDRASVQDVVQVSLSRLSSVSGGGSGAGTAAAAAAALVVEVVVVVHGT